MGSPNPCSQLEKDGFPPPDSDYTDEELRIYCIVEAHYDRLRSDLSPKSRETWFAAMSSIKLTGRNAKGVSNHKLGNAVRKRGCWISWLILQHIFPWGRLGTYADHIARHWEVPDNQAFDVDWPLDARSHEARVQMPIKLDPDQEEVQETEICDRTTRNETNPFLYKGDSAHENSVVPNKRCRVSDPGVTSTTKSSVKMTSHSPKIQELDVRLRALELQMAQLQYSQRQNNSPESSSAPVSEAGASNGLSQYYLVTRRDLEIVHKMALKTASELSDHEMKIKDHEKDTNEALEHIITTLTRLQTFVIAHEKVIGTLDKDDIDDRC